MSEQTKHTQESSSSNEPQDPVISLKNHLKGAVDNLIDIYEQTIGKDIEEKIMTADKAVTKGLADACDSMIEIAVDIKKKLKERQSND